MVIFRNSCPLHWLIAAGGGLAVLFGLGLPAKTPASSTSLVFSLDFLTPSIAVVLAQPSSSSSAASNVTDTDRGGYRDGNSTASARGVLGNGQEGDGEDGEKVPEIPKLPKPRSSRNFTLDAVFNEEDLSELASNLRNSEFYSDGGVGTRLAMTLFAPINSAFEGMSFSQGGSVDWEKQWWATETDRGSRGSGGGGAMAMFEGLGGNDEELEIPDEAAVEDKVFMFHVVSPRVISPRMVKYNETIEIASRNGELLTLSRRGKTGAFGDLFVNDAQVVEIVKTRRGYIYKIDKFLTPRWNPGLNMIDWIRRTPGFSKTVYLMDSFPDLAESMSTMGPMTMFLVPDEGWVMPNGQDVPKCIFTSLVEPENRSYLEAMFLWMILPGIWNRTLIEDRNWLPVLAGSPKLAVAHVRQAHHDAHPHHDPQHNPLQVPPYDTPYRAPHHSPSSPGHPPLSHQNGGGGGNDRESRGNNAERREDGEEEEEEGEKSSSPPKRTHYRDLFSFVEGKQVMQWDIPVFNGLIHILNTIPFRPDMDLRPIALWNCVHRFCFECPLLASVVLEYFDNWGTMPGDSPELFDAPESVRPDWVCKGSHKWYPPGWRSGKWRHYVAAAQRETKSVARVQRQAWEGWQEAAVEVQRIQHRYDEINRRAEMSRVYFGEGMVRKHQNIGFWDMKFSYMRGPNARAECKGDEKELKLAHGVTMKSLRKIDSPSWRQQQHWQ